MSTTMYTNGASGALVTVIVETKRVQAHLQNGYVCDPSELISPTKEKVGTDNISEEALRAEAKGKGIGNYHNKKIETLKRDLGYVD